MGWSNRYPVERPADIWGGVASQVGVSLVEIRERQEYLVRIFLSAWLEQSDEDGFPRPTAPSLFSDPVLRSSVIDGLQQVALLWSGRHNLPRTWLRVSTRDQPDLHKS